MKIGKFEIDFNFEGWWVGVDWWFKPDRVISLSFHPRHMFHFWCHSNGAVKGRDNCYDFNLHLLGFFFSYTDYEYWRFKKV